MSTFQKPSIISHLKVDTNVPAVEGPRSSKARTPYCGVCFKAKQPASVYNSHWTRMNPNPRSPITCPLILQTICNYCKKKSFRNERALEQHEKFCRDKKLRGLVL